MLLELRESLRLGALPLAHAAGYLDEQSSQYETLANSNSHFRLGFSLTLIPTQSANESLEPKCPTHRPKTKTVLIWPGAELGRSILRLSVEVVASLPICPNSSRDVNVADHMKSLVLKTLMTLLAGLMLLPAGWCCWTPFAAKELKGCCPRCAIAVAKPRGCCVANAPERRPVGQPCCCTRDSIPVRGLIENAPHVDEVPLTDSVQFTAIPSVVLANVLRKSISIPERSHRVLHNVWRC